MEDVFLRVWEDDKLHFDVAILVIMEDVFLQKAHEQNESSDAGRNPCYNGRCISTYILIRWHSKTYKSQSLL